MVAGGKSEISSFPFSDPPTLRAIKRPDGPSLGGWLEEDGAQVQVMLSLNVHCKVHLHSGSF